MADEEIRKFCGKVDGLAFLPLGDIEEGMLLLAAEAPDNLKCIVEYFDENYVTGGPSRRAARFHPAIWNVHDATLQERARTNNQCEAWNMSFKCLVGHANPSLWTVVKSIDKDAHMVEVDVLRWQRGELPKKRSKKGSAALQKRMKTLCLQYVKKEKTMQEFLSAVGEAIRLN